MQKSINVKVMVENKSGSNLLYLPLDKLIREQSTGERPSGLDSSNQQTSQEQLTHQVKILVLLCEILLVKVGMVLLII